MIKLNVELVPRVLKNLPRLVWEIIGLIERWPCLSTSSCALLVVPVSTVSIMRFCYENRHWDLTDPLRCSPGCTLLTIAFFFSEIPAFYKNELIILFLLGLTSYGLCPYSRRLQLLDLLAFRCTFCTVQMSLVSVRISFYSLLKCFEL